MSRKFKRRKRPANKKQLVEIDAKIQEALSLHRSGHLSQAAEIYQKALLMSPQHGDILNLFGTLSLQQQEYNQAISLLEKAVKLYPGRPDYLSNLGSANKELGHLDAAEAAYKRAISLQPDHIGALYNLAGVLAKRQKLAEAEKAYKEVLTLKPGAPEALRELGTLYLTQKKFTEAINSFEKILQHAPHDIKASCAIGTALQGQGKVVEALNFYKTAIKEMPTKGVLYNDMANTLTKLGRLHDALTAYQKAVEFNPELRNAYINLAWAYREHGQLDEAIACFTKLRAQKNLSPQDHSDLLFSLNYSPEFNNQALLSAAKQWWEAHGQQQSNSFSHPPRPVNMAKLKVGFVSPDFSKHPVGFFLAPLFRAIDKDRIEIICYAQMNERQDDEITSTLKNRANHWHNISLLSDDQAAAKIYNDQIDILIDLAGHTANNRLMVFARKPAPIQITWLGYVNTTGLPNIDYRISDNIADPIDSEVTTSETIYRLPNGFFCYSPHAESPDYHDEPPVRKNGFITFGSFNNLPKITPEVIALWSEILAKLPEARLLFTSSQFRDKAIISRYTTLFTNAGVNAERINFHGSLPLKEYLSLISTVDIALDPFPHNGHTITCDTLWMGVPVITLLGKRYAGRMTASALTTIGLTELIATDKIDYLKKCTSLASDIDRLSLLRHGMRRRIKDSPMYDQKRFAGDFERALWDIWEI